MNYFYKAIAFYICYLFMSDLKFRSSIWMTVWGTIACNFWIFLVFPLFVLWIDNLVNLRYSVLLVSIILIAVMIAFAIIISIYCVYAFQVIIKPTGLYGYNFWGNYSFVTWNEIDKIKAYNLFGCKYLRLFFSNSPTPLWIPLFLVEQHKFNRIVIERTDKNNPLHLALLDLDNLFNNLSLVGKSKVQFKQARQTKPSPTETLLKLNSISPSRDTKIAPWMENNIFSPPPSTDTYGYCQGEKLVTCSRPSLIENVKSDHKKLINLVWIPETVYLVAPEEIVWLNDALYAREKTHFQKALQNDLINALVWGAIFGQHLQDSSNKT